MKQDIHPGAMADLTIANICITNTLQPIWHDWRVSGYTRSAASRR